MGRYRPGSSRFVVRARGRFPARRRFHRAAPGRDRPAGSTILVGTADGGRQTAAGTADGGQRVHAAHDRMLARSNLSGRCGPNRLGGDRGAPCQAETWRERAISRRAVRVPDAGHPRAVHAIFSSRDSLRSPNQPLRSVAPARHDSPRAPQSPADAVRAIRVPRRRARRRRR